MISYVFWHRPRDGVDRLAYQRAAERFHRSLRRAPPAGFQRSALLRVGRIPWLQGEDWYEDWYLLDDFAALGVLNEAVVAAGHRSAHEHIAGLAGGGAGGVYRLVEGGGESIALPRAIWVSHPAGARPLPLGDMLGDGIDCEHAGLWQRQLVLGPAPEHCLLVSEPPAGVAPTRLPRGWRADVLEREAIFSA